VSSRTDTTETILNRRKFLCGLTPGAVAAPFAVGAQPARKGWRVGYLGDGPRADRPGINFEPFRDGLRELGHLEGQNIVLEERWTEGRAERLAELAAELVRLKVDVIVTHGVRATSAAQEATMTIPIVAVMPDPVGAELGGTTSGCSACAPSLASASSLRLSWSCFDRHRCPRWELREERLQTLDVTAGDFHPIRLAVLSATPGQRAYDIRILKGAKPADLPWSRPRSLSS
jgi:hypothetical protein